MRFVKEEFGIKKLILLFILIACMVFIFMQKNNFLINSNYLSDTKVDTSSKNEISEVTNDPTNATDAQLFNAKVMTAENVSVKGTKTVTETFVAQDHKLNKVILNFHNPSNYTASGTVYVKVKDSKGKTVCQSDLDANLVANDTITTFDFNGNTDALNSNKIVNNRIVTNTAHGVNIEKGQTYTLEITTKNVKSQGDFGIYLSNTKVNNSDVLKIDGVKNSKLLQCAVQYLHFNIFVFTFFILVLLLAAFIILLPMRKLDEVYNRRLKAKGKKPVDLNKRLLRILFILSPFAAFYMIEKIAALRTIDILAMLPSLYGFLNIVVIGFVWWLIYTITNRTKETAILLMFISFVFALVNYMLIQFRDCPLIATDFSSIGTAKDVAASYTLVFGKPCLWAITLTVAYICITASLKTYKGLKLKTRAAVLLIMCLWGGSLYGVFTNNTLLRTQKLIVSGFNPKNSYNSKGYSLAFALTVTSSRIKKPSNYSEEYVAKVASKYTSDSAGKVKSTSTKSPNVIVIMNEAFSDLKADGDVKTSSDYMPFYNSLKKNTIKGTLHTSIFGGGTADTEFEFLTGNSMMFLPFRSIPYNNEIKVSSPSFTQNLKAEGYGGLIAFHPGASTSYNRNKVYPKLGFSKFVSLEDLKDPEYLRSYVSDKEDFSQVIKMYEKYRASNSTIPFYMFNVTIQNHSGYKLTDGVVKKEITITDENQKEEEAEQYLNLIKKTDEALESLVTYYKNVDEPTVIVMFGDHQPRVGDSFYNSLYGKKSNQLSLEETETKYHVPVMIWANYDIGQKDDLDISANYLSSYLAKVTKQKLTGYNKYLLDLYKKVPVITSICYKGSNGKIYDIDQKSQYSKYIKQYQKVQYNNLVDYKNRVKGFYYLKK